MRNTNTHLQMVSAAISTLTSPRAGRMYLQMVVAAISTLPGTRAGRYAMVYFGYWGLLGFFGNAAQGFTYIMTFLLLPLLFLGSIFSGGSSAAGAVAGVKVIAIGLFATAFFFSPGSAGTARWLARLGLVFCLAGLTFAHCPAGVGR